MSQDFKPQLKEAITHHQGGRFAQAEAVYRQILGIDPDQPEATHGIGFLYLHQKRFDEAELMIGQSTVLDPANARYVHNLAEIYRETDRPIQAISTYKKALVLRPDYPIAHNNIGNTYLFLDRLDEAIVHFRRAIELQSVFPEAHYNLGLALKAQGKLPESAAEIFEAVQQRPTYYKACTALASIMHKLRRPEDALKCLEHAQQLDPENPSLLNNLAVMLLELKRLEEAEPILAKALRIWPDFPEALSNSANLMHLTPAPEAERKQKGAGEAEAQRLAKMLEMYERALAATPNHTEILVGRACAQHSLGHTRRAMEMLRHVLTIDPKMHDALWNLALMHLLCGEFEQGWELYEVRRKLPHLFPGLPSNAPEWHGEDLAGKRILLGAEQGLGDEIQMVRYAPLVAQRAARVIVQAPGSLVRLFKTIPGIDVVSSNEPLPEHDLQIPIMSLPRLFKTRLESIPQQVPYLCANSGDAPAQLRDAPKNKLKVGLAWWGNPTNLHNRHRSVHLELLAPLARVQNVQFYGLQKGPGSEQVAAGGGALNLIDLGPELTDMAVTAAAVMQLDLIITVDTALAHLAGALGRPVWTMIFFPPEWRWLLNRDDCPWYPSMRLFRMPRRGDWPPVIEQVAGALAQFHS